MKALILPILLAASPIAAQTAPNPDVDQGVSLLQEGAKLLLRGMASELQPALQDMAEAMQQAKPQLIEILTMMGDITNYHAPERLQNGDILIRRKTPAEIEAEASTAPETEL